MNRLFRFTCSPGHNGPAQKNNGCFSKEKKKENDSSVSPHYLPYHILWLEMVIYDVWLDVWYGPISWFKLSN